MTHTFDSASIRSEFPVMQHCLYLDSAHQTPLANCVRDALNQFLVEGNQMAGPKPVWMARVEETRAKVAKLLNARPTEIAFTKNTSEGLNIAANAVPLKTGDTVLMLEGDHPNNAYAWLNLKRKGVNVRFLKLQDAQVANADTFASHIDESTRVISLSHVTFHAGQRHDIASIGRLCAKAGIYLVVDVMQSIGVLPVDVKAMGVSVLAAGCHKGLLVPQGLGLLFVREDLQELQPAYVAMSSLENPPSDYVARPEDLMLRRDAGRFEFGNFNLPDLHALSRSVDFILRLDPVQIEAHMLSLGDHLLEKLDELGVAVVGPRKRTERAHIYVLDLPVAKWVNHFAQHHVRVSPERGGVRISFGVFNTLDDVDQVVGLIAQRQAQFNVTP
ncbi:aminotransferase class V-fold PLP-dependent enzyme [Simplicispira suum]|uniref:Aminotransferase n=1 Tax=Simplicispira suum TaxID=2109915 RepID=A0A2S0N374_9BURK|nr:aminotransferase class V-fold PLP-dependent enzyme [Simplicispira suum]AVO42373.1 aminotransferase [Simplicispira suum]